MAPLSFRQTIGIPDLTASPTDSALIIVDAQNEYAEGKLAVHDVASSRSAIASLLQKYRSANGVIVHVQHQVPSGAPIFTPDTPLAQEFDELKLREGEELVRKQFPGSFTQTDLDAILKKKEVKKVVITGYMAHVCVSTTAREAMQHGYQVVLVEDGIGDRDIPGINGSELTKTVLLELNDSFGTVLKSSDIN